MKNILFLSLIFFLQASNLSSQSNVTGQVMATENNEALIGVTIISLPSGKGTLTDFDGNYAINIGIDDSLRF